MLAKWGSLSAPLDRPAGQGWEQNPSRNPSGAEGLKQSGDVAAQHPTWPTCRVDNMHSGAQATWTPCSFLIPQWLRLGSPPCVGQGPSATTCAITGADGVAAGLHNGHGRCPRPNKMHACLTARRLGDRSVFLPPPSISSGYRSALTKAPRTPLISMARGLENVAAGNSPQAPMDARRRGN